MLVRQRTSKTMQNTWKPQLAVAGKGHPLHTSIIHISIAELPFYTHFHAELPFYTHFHCRTSILHPLPLPNFHSTPTSIAELPFYTHFHCRTSILHPLPFYTHFHSTTTPKFAHVQTSVASSPATHTVLGLLSVDMSIR